METFGVKTHRALRDWRVLITALAGLLCHAASQPAMAAEKSEKFTAGGCTLSNLQVTTNSGSEATLTVDYDYGSRGRPPIRLTTLIEQKGNTNTASRFHVADTEVPVGTGSLTIKVRYLETEKALTTDRIRFLFQYPVSKYLLGTASFDRQIKWGLEGAEPARTTQASSPGMKKQAKARPAPPAGPQAAAAPAVPEPVVQGDPALIEVPPPSYGGSFTALNSTNRAPWQERLTLGPGDVLHFSIFGDPDLTVEDVFVGPDGRVSYLEAQGIMAAGLTIDELRQKFDEELGKFRRSPRTIITPAAFNSKKYFVLGRVSQKGVFTLDRPVTVIEAIARARGFETGMADRNLVEMADLSRSFLARRGERVEVDFEKLFMEGDLSQNIALEPNDYLYFPATDSREVYVLGEVKFPGAVNFSGGVATVGAIAQRGGFTEKAWKRKVLVVRGSLNRPETFVVNLSDVLSAKSPDFKLQAKDIVYVSSRPWAKAEELLDVLATSFVQAAVITWTGGNIGSIIK